MKLSSPMHQPSRPHPTLISLPSSSPYPLTHQSNPDSFVYGHFFFVSSCSQKKDKKRASFMSFPLGTTGNKVVSFCLSEKQEMTKVVSTISASMQHFQSQHFGASALGWFKQVTRFRFKRFFQYQTTKSNFTSFLVN